MICMEKFVFDTNILNDLKHFNPLVFKSLWENIQFMLELNFPVLLRTGIRKPKKF